MKREPAVVISAVAAVVTATAGLLVAVGVIDTDIEAAFGLWVGAVVELASGLWTRGRVYSPSSVARIRAEQSGHPSAYEEQHPAGGFVSRTMLAVLAVFALALAGVLVLSSDDADSAVGTTYVVTHAEIERGVIPPGCCDPPDRLHEIFSSWWFSGRYVAAECDRIGGTLWRTRPSWWTLWNGMARYGYGCLDIDY